MAVPAHDERDFAFAKKYELPIRRVVEPKFIAEAGSESALKPGMELVRRDVVSVIIRNPKDDRYLCISWKEAHMNGLVTGGIEGGEDVVSAAMREIHEETGYKNVRLVFNPDFAIHSLFYHRMKKVNRWARFQYLFFELENEERDPLGEEERRLHDIVWKRKDELRNFFSVIEGAFVLNLIDNPEYIYTGEGVLNGSGKFDGMDSEAAKWEITKFVGGERKTQFRLRDWSIGRQRYWGPPVPMIHCDACAAAGMGEQKEMPGWYAVPEDQLPVLLPYLKDFQPTGDGVSPLAADKEFYETKCPGCGGAARRETDVIDNFVDSSWYYLRYPSTHDDEHAWNPAITKRWFPVSSYIGGAEHSVLHLLYVRFVALAFHDMGFLDFSAKGGSASGGEEPFPKFIAHGLITKDGAKMSKSKGNVVNPDDYFGKFGADIMRMHLAFMAPLEDGGDFREETILGIERFLNRILKFAERKFVEDVAETSELKRLVNRTVKKVGEDIEALKHNTAISAMMILFAEMEKADVSRETWEVFLKLLAPFAPHMTEEIWRETLGHLTSIHREPWPEFDSSIIKEDTITLVFQVNGRTRDTVQAPADISEADATALALASEKIKAHVAGATPKKIIFVPGRLINIVI
jgi:leucyl-tRNA synthetase